MRWLVTLALVAASGCDGTAKGTETGNPNMVAARIASGAWSSDPELVSPGPGGQITVDHAWLWLEPLAFTTEADCAAEDSTDDRGESSSSPALVELVGGGLLAQKVPKARYCRLDLDLDSPADAPPTAPPDLEAATLVIEATLDDGTPLQVRSSESLGIRLEGTFTIAPERPDFALGFDVAGWFDGLDPTDLPLVDDTLMLDEEENPAEAERFLSNLAASVRLFEDLDGNGSIDPVDIAAGSLASPEN